jgi:hypothetical protein
MRLTTRAGEFVGWYNGHPHFAYRDFELESTETAAIIGTGNVALDVASNLFYLFLLSRSFSVLPLCMVGLIHKCFSRTFCVL